MLNASDVQVLQKDKSLTLPKSSADAAAKENILLLVNQTNVLLQGKKMASIDDILASNEDVITSLVDELNYQSQRETVQPDQTKLAAPEGSEPAGKAITIMADEAMPYELLKKLMQSCAQAGYTDIALAVEHKENAIGEVGGVK
jgi:biopolymer transport protein ExbD